MRSPKLAVLGLLAAFAVVATPTSAWAAGTPHAGTKVVAVATVLKGTCRYRSPACRW